jgi:hypothetical protein
VGEYGFNVQCDLKPERRSCVVRQSQECPSLILLAARIHIMSSCLRTSRCFFSQCPPFQINIPGRKRGGRCRHSGVLYNEPLPTERIHKVRDSLSKIPRNEVPAVAANHRFGFSKHPAAFIVRASSRPLISFLGANELTDQS